MKDPSRVICSMLWLFLFLAHDISVNSLLRTAPVPIQLNLRRIPAARGNLTHEVLHSSSDPQRQPRSRTTLFQHVLGLVPGEEFEFHLPKWKALQRCGLFFNLTARTVVVDHQVQLNISGIELPSITFAPELSLTPSLRDPELSGGLLFKDKNFRGLGEQVEVFIYHKEGVDGEVGKLPPAVRAKWTDCSIGKPSQISLSYEAEGIRDLLHNFSPNPPSSWTDFSKRVSVWSSRCSASLQSAFSLGNWLQGRVAFEPSIRALCGMENESPSSVLTGTKTACDFTTWGGIQTSTWYSDGWRSFGKEKIAPFRQLGLAMHFPTLSKPFRVVETVTNTSQQANEGYFELLGKVRVNAMHAWGEGCLPEEHFYSLGNPISALRAWQGEQIADYCQTLRSLVAIKADGYLDVLQRYKVGVFGDVAAYRNRKETQRHRLAATYGLSLRALGFRIDAGLPVGPLRTPRFHLGFDLGE